MLITFLNELELICLHIVKWFQVLLCNINTISAICFHTVKWIYILLYSLDDINNNNNHNHNDNNNNIVPIVIVAFGTVTKGLLKGLEDLEVGGRVETIQMTALLRTARILRGVLRTWGDLLLLKLQWKTIN